MSDSVTSWTIPSQASLSMGFPRQEYWSGLPFPPPGDLPNPGTKSASLPSPALAVRFFTWEAQGSKYVTLNSNMNNEGNREGAETQYNGE